MVKPICVIYFPDHYSITAGGKAVEPVEMMKELNGWHDYGAPSEPNDKFGGYQYWCFLKDDIAAPEFQVFHPKDFTEADYAELKELVMTNLKANDVPANRE